MKKLANALALSILERMWCQRQERPLPEQELEEVYAQTLYPGSRVEADSLLRGTARMSLSLRLSYGWNSLYQMA